MNTIIIGYGNIGRYIYSTIVKYKPDIYDLTISTKRNIKYDLAFVCVPTPPKEKTLRCDISIVEQAIQETDADIYVIKSTVEPGTCDYLVQKYNKQIVFSPEFYGTTQHSVNFNEDFIILGGAGSTCHKVQQFFQTIYPAQHKFYITDFKTAELSKYMINSYLATKVNFCNAYWEICQSLGVDYDRLRELFIADERVNASHTFVYDDAPYWDSHCFNKDVPAIAEFSNNKFLQNVVEYNNELKEKY